MKRVFNEERRRRKGGQEGASKWKGESVRRREKEKADKGVWEGLARA